MGNFSEKYESNKAKLLKQLIENLIREETLLYLQEKKAVII